MSEDEHFVFRNSQTRISRTSFTHIEHMTDMEASSVGNDLFLKQSRIHMGSRYIRIRRITVITVLLLVLTVAAVAYFKFVLQHQGLMN